MTKITNNSPAKQGFTQQDGSLVFVSPGESHDLDLSDGDLEKAKGRSYLTVEGFERKTQSRTLAEVNAGLVVGNKDLDAANAEIERLRTELTTATGRVSELEAEAEDLRSKIKNQESDDRVTDEPWVAQVDDMESKHRGAGQYSVMLGDKEIVQRLSKDQSDEFNGIEDAADRVEWIRAHQ